MDWMSFSLGAVVFAPLGALVYGMLLQRSRASKRRNRVIAMKRCSNTACDTWPQQVEWTGRELCLMCGHTLELIEDISQLASVPEKQFTEEESRRLAFLKNLYERGVFSELSPAE